MNAATITHMLGGKWHRRYGTAPCPVCQPEGHKGQDALTLSDGHDGRLLAHCKKFGCAFTDILAAAGISAGDYCPPDPAELARCEAERQAEVAKKAGQAARCWDEAQPIAGTVAETYLRGRGITCPLPDTLRFDPACWHGLTAKRHPGLVALVEGGDSFAVHRTYLRPDGNGKAAIDPAKLMLGATSGGAIRFTQARGALVVAEGIETALSLASGLFSRPAKVWAALSTSGMKALNLPPDPGELVIASDGDQPGREAAHALAERAHAAGWTVSLLPAPDGQDWNDVLVAKEVSP
ncbi:MAG: toprim domain-containing protein [Rhodobacteraceae bacterium]|nr:toprim domain-containing protein [Paracoccaceae bacterium]